LSETEFALHPFSQEARGYFHRFADSALFRSKHKRQPWRRIGIWARNRSQGTHAIQADVDCVFFESLGALTGIYSGIADDLRVPYQSGCNSTNRVDGGGWRNMRVELDGRSDAVIRTRRGCYVRKEAVP
jgi:hypothetical protein